MTRKYVGLALGVGAIVLAVSGCQSDAGGAGKASDSASATAPATPLDAVRTPAVVASAPTAIARDERDARAGLTAGATPSATPGGSTPGATMPPAPVGVLRDGYLNGLAVLNIWLVHDPDRAVDNGRRQCLESM